jgi:Ankyrin repeats (3 copies)
VTDDYGIDAGSALHYAVRDGHAAVAARLIEKGLSVNTEDSNMCTPLHVAMYAECVVLLLSYGADIEACDDAYNTPLMKAASHKEPDIARILIAGGALLDCTNNYGTTALYEACDCARIPTAMLLLEAGADVHCGEHGANGRRALHSAIDPRLGEDSGYTVFNVEYEGQLELIDTLLEHGADVDALCLDGTPLMQTDDRGFIRRLVRGGANPWLGDWEAMSTEWMAIVGEEYERARGLRTLQAREMGTRIRGS